MKPSCQKAFTRRYCISKYASTVRMNSSSSRHAHSKQSRANTAGHNWTPLSMPAKSANSGNNVLSTSIGKTWNNTQASIQKAYIALGSNLGDRIGWIEKACDEMSSRGIKVTKTSSLWETEPMYVLDQGNFINGVCEVSSDLSARYLHLLHGSSVYPTLPFFPLVM